MPFPQGIPRLLFILFVIQFLLLPMTSLAAPPVSNGNGGQHRLLVANPSSASFGSVQVGSSKTEFETLTNSGGENVTISQATATGAAFSLSGLNLPLSLSGGQSITFSVTFAPKSSGSASGNLSVISNASNSTLTIALSGTGTGTGQLAVSPTTSNFGSVVVGTSNSLIATLSASGSSVTISSATSTNSEFSLSGLSFPLTIASGYSVSLTVKFTPQVSGTAAGNFSFVSNASNSPTTETLTGTGTTALQHTVSLSWSPDISAVAGYNVYRGTNSCGPYSKMNSVLDPSTTYTDGSAQSGQTYYYATTAVSTSGMESAYSNQVQAMIPSP
jgi:Abnormal spindle-like microcephaly-assoc'd, ASPM-SPD-2-Hydin